MSRKEIKGAIEKTLGEIKEYKEQNPEDINSSTLRDMNDYRGYLEDNLDYYNLIHPRPIKVIASSVIGSAGIVLSPVILAGGLAYLGGKEVYRKVNEYYSRR
ncbi:MAG: hypothetical protein KAT28_04860 [Candidatus Aenigmarchaeota archaeon]|nr:hypothetical protein [Candidatus Aenigmarchaeota archaeon]